MSAYTTPVRDGAGHMVMAPTPPTNIRNLIAQKEEVRVSRCSEGMIIQQPPAFCASPDDERPLTVTPDEQINRSSWHCPSSV